MELFVKDQYDEIHAIFNILRDKEDLAWEYVDNKYPIRDIKETLFIEYNEAIQLATLIEDHAMCDYLLAINPREERNNNFTYKFIIE